mgnify:FL=1
MPRYTFQDSKGFSGPVAAGDYVIGIEAASIGLSKSTGNEQIMLEWRVLHPVSGKGPIVYDYLQFSEKMQWKLDTWLKSIDRAPAKGTEIDIDAAFLEGVINLVAWAELSVEEYNGKRSNKIARYLTGDGKDDPLTVIGQKAKPRPTTPRVNAPTAEVDDLAFNEKEIPF